MRKKKTKTDLWRDYGLVKPPKPRYEGRKGIYWHLFSKKRRREDFERFNGMCIDQCGKRAERWEDFDGGHYVPASKCGFGLLLDPLNVHGQLKACNNPTWSPHSPIGFGHGIDERYGPGTAEKLWNRRHEITKEWSQFEYDWRIKEML